MIDKNSQSIFKLYFWELWTFVSGVALTFISTVSGVGSPGLVFAGMVLSLLAIRSYTLLTKGITESKETTIPLVLVIAKLTAIFVILHNIRNGDAVSTDLISFLSGLLSFLAGAIFVLFYNGAR